MIKTLLVPASGDAVDAPVFASALAVARAFAAHIDFLHVRIDAVAMAAGMATDGAGALVGGLIERIEADSDQREAQAKASFDDFCRNAGVAVVEAPRTEAAPSAQWHREVGSEPDWIADYGRAADLIVVGRPGADAGLGSQSLEAALLQTGRPLLIPPASGLGALPEVIAIAWKPTAEAARAVGAAMPFLERAKAVVILGVEEGQPGGAETADRLAAGLGWHGLRASSTRLKPGAEGAVETLIAAAAAEAGMLVMGGYGHSRLREWVFGGFTARVLRAAPIPVLMAH